MFITRLAYSIFFFALGLAAGVLWNPRSGSTQAPDNCAVSQSKCEHEKTVAKMTEIYGKETAEFLRQSEDLTIRIKKNPINAGFSSDGRFVIRLFGSDESIASELLYPHGKGKAELVRHYSFSCGDKKYSCDFGRSDKDSRVTNVVFNITDVKGGELSYFDSDGDGRWDKFDDLTHQPPRFYKRDGLCWEEYSVEAGAFPSAEGKMKSGKPISPRDRGEKAIMMAKQEKPAQTNNAEVDNIDENARQEDEALRGSRQVDLDLDQESAVQIAEIILVKVYGKIVLSQRPWNVTKAGKVFTISGTMPKNSYGGVASIEINRTNAQVMSIIHLAKKHDFNRFRENTRDTLLSRNVKNGIRSL